MDKILKAIRLCEESLRVARHDADGLDPKYEKEQVFLYKTALQALREKLERENSPKPEALTLERLREMGGQPVWFVDLEDLYSEWRILEEAWSDEVSSEYEWQANSSTMSTDYGKTWVCYPTKPETEGD